MLTLINRAACGYFDDYFCLQYSAAENSVRAKQILNLKLRIIYTKVANPLFNKNLT